MAAGAVHRSDANHVNKRMAGNADPRFSQCLLHRNILADIMIFLPILIIVFCFLEILVSLSILLYFLPRYNLEYIHDHAP